MKRIVQFSFFFLLTLFSIGQKDDYRLVINPKGHTSTITGAVLTPDEKLLITVSKDKSVKIWSTKYGNLVDEIFGQRGEGSEGQLYAVAISPDGKYLAVGGHLIEKIENKAQAFGLIRIYDFVKRKLIKVLKGHQNVVHSLAFSPNGKYLASAGGDGHVLVWNMKELSLYKDFSSHTATARTVCFMGDNKLVSGGWDNKLILYDIAEAKIIKTILCKYPINEVCYSGELKKLIVAYNEYSKAQIMNNELELVQEVEAHMPIGTISTKENKILIGQERYPYMTSMFEWINNEFKITNAFNGLNNTVTCSGILNDGIAYCTGGRDNEIVFWNHQPADKNGMVGFSTEGVRLSGYGMGFCAVGFADNAIAFTQGDCDKPYGEGTLKTLFDLESGGLFKLSPTKQEVFKGIYKTKKDFSIKHEQGGTLNYTDACLGLFDKGSKIWHITNNEYSGYSTKSYTFSGPEMIASGNSPDIYMYNMEGTQTAVLKGHESEVRGLWTDIAGKYIISASSDQTIRIWNVSTVGSQKNYMKYEELYPSSIDFFKSKYPTLDFTNPAGMKKLYETVLNDFGDDTAHYLITSAVIYPEATIFIGWNNEWIIWTNDGYFKASKEGSKYIGYHINMGLEKDAKYYPFDQFDLKFNRPDIINQRLGIGDSTYNESLKKAHERRLKKMGLEESQLSDNKNIPEVEILSSVENTEEVMYKLEMTATDEKADLFKINIYNNDVPVFGTKGYLVEEKDKKGLKHTFDIPLVPGQNKIQVSVVNKMGAESFRETITILCTQAKQKGNLYIVTIGVSEYASNSFNLKYAAKDAGDVSTLFLQSKIYDEVFTKTFTNNQVKKDMLPQIKAFLSKAEANDQVIIFIAGHGVLNSEFEYYFASHDMDFLAPEKAGISYSEIENLLDEIKALKKILFMDTCHSGEVDKDDIEKDNQAIVQVEGVEFRSVGAGVKHKVLGMQQTTELMKEVFNDMRKGTGSNIISSASGYSLAKESEEWHNGLFTYVLLNGIKSMDADMNKDGQVMLSELKSFVGTGVSEMSKGAQVPSNRNENISFDYRIW